jgi:hypothetical protein
MKTKAMLTIALTLLMFVLVCPSAYGQDPETAKEPSGSASKEPFIVLRLRGFEPLT